MKLQQKGDITRYTKPYILSRPSIPFIACQAFVRIWAVSSTVQFYYRFCGILKVLPFSKWTTQHKAINPIRSLGERLSSCWMRVHYDCIKFHMAELWSTETTLSPETQASSLRTATTFIRLSLCMPGPVVAPTYHSTSYHVVRREFHQRPDYLPYRCIQTLIVCYWRRLVQRLSEDELWRRRVLTICHRS